MAATTKEDILSGHSEPVNTNRSVEGVSDRVSGAKAAVKLCGIEIAKDSAH